ncbi:MAG: D-glycero-alpha-D-manno-heptose-1,7-bisphosphate 7-phosphatase [Gemmatimonadaceae bacterium]
MASHAAVFLDRDGTINVDTVFVRRASDVALLPGVGRAIAQLNAADVPVIVVTNQSGIGRGVFTRSEYDAVAARIGELLAHEAAYITATYVCPHAPDDGACECRKPGTLLFRAAGVDFHLDLTASWYVGDRWRDVAPALELGGHGVLVPTAHTTAADIEQARAAMLVMPTLGDAVDRMLVPGALLPGVEPAP